MGSKVNTFSKINHLIRRFLLWLIDFIKFFYHTPVDIFVRFLPSYSQDKVLLLIKTDEIGDYFLFRNYLIYIKNSEKFKDYKIILCGNQIWKNVTEDLDILNIDECIWINKNKFEYLPFYRYFFLKCIRKLHASTAINCSFSRSFYCNDTLISVTSAKEKIGFLTDYSNSYKWQVRISNKYYTSLIDSNREVFEFYKNRIFFENILQTSIDLTKPEIIIVNEINFNVPNNNYVVFFVGGKSKYKRWNISNFVKVAEYIVSTYDYNIILIGTGKETKLNREFNKEIKYQEKVIDMTGETSLIESINLLDKAKLLISNDSGVVHAATSVNTKAIVIFNGTHFGRFLPYPSRSYAKISTIFPEAISQTFSEKSFLYKKYKYRSLLNINSILPEKIIEKVKEIV